MKTRIVFLPDEFTHLTYETSATPEAVIAAVRMGTWRSAELPNLPLLNLGGLPLETCLLGVQTVLIYHPLAAEPKYIEYEPKPRLSPRQIEVLHLLACEYNIKQVAEGMQLSVRSVYSIMAGVRKKLNAPSNMHALRIAAELGIISPRH